MRLGEYDFGSESNSRRDFDVEKIYMHETYNRKTYVNDLEMMWLALGGINRLIRSGAPVGRYENDIALLKLKKKTTFNNDIWPICLPPPRIQLEGKSAYVTGTSPSSRFITLNSFHCCRSRPGWGGVWPNMIIRLGHDLLQRPIQPGAPRSLPAHLEEQRVQERLHPDHHR